MGGSHLNPQFSGHFNNEVLLLMLPSHVSTHVELLCALATCGYIADHFSCVKRSNKGSYLHFFLINKVQPDAFTAQTTEYCC